MQDLGKPVEAANLGQRVRSVLGHKPGTVLELVYPRPQEFRSSDGEALGQARHVAF